MNRPLIIASLILSVVALEFWAGSRYPSLGEKALMGDSVSLEPLGFDRVLVADESAGVTERILVTTVNWVETNRRGMSFGVLFAACIMTLLNCVRVRSLGSRFGDSLLGAAIGVPLGVCVNCAAPIAKGMYDGGLKAETSLAAMLSSPTLNIVVISILFSLYPPYIAWLKIGLTVFAVFVCVPMISKVTPGRLRMQVPRGVLPVSATRANVVKDFSDQAQAIGGWGRATLWTLARLAKNLWYVFKITVPLMLVAGLLGAITVTVLPWNGLVGLLPTGGSLAGRLLLLAGISSVGLFLPVPIAFDVLVPAILLAAGLPVQYVVALLFTLGIYSVYSYMIVAEAISSRLALKVAFVLVVLGMLGGLGARFFEKHQQARADIWLANLVVESDSVTLPQRDPPEPGLSFEAIRPTLLSQKVSYEPVQLEMSGASVSVLRSQMVAEQTSQATGKIFMRETGPSLGISIPYYASTLHLTPGSQFRGIAAGDVHQDGWVDLVIADREHLLLLANVGGRYVRQRLVTDDANYTRVINAAIVDLDGDGWLDIYFSTYGQGNFYIRNQSGRFEDERVVELPNLPGAVATAAPAFGDLDQDGDLDAYLGNWSVGPFSWDRTLPSSRNATLLREGDGYRVVADSSVNGETLSTLLTDWSGDGVPDIAVGNDFRPPDVFLESVAPGAWRSQTEGIPRSTETTMSITAADIDNDLVPEIFVAQASHDNASERLPFRQTCEELGDSSMEAECSRTLSSLRRAERAVNHNRPSLCEDESSEARRWDCRVHYLLSLEAIGADAASASQRSGLRGFGSSPLRARMVEAARSGYAAPRFSDPGSFVRSNREYNVLLFPDGKSWSDRAAAKGVAQTDWSWNSEFADVNHDGWQDLFVANGLHMRVSGSATSNRLFLNKEGSFQDETHSSGVELFHPSVSSVFVDYDRDSDLDLIVLPVTGPVWVFENLGPLHPSIRIVLEDHVGNSAGIGSTLVLESESIPQQMRVLRASGGFGSYPPAIAHFGIGDSRHGDRLTISWSTGERTVLEGPLEAGHVYRVVREGPDGQ